MEVSGQVRATPSLLPRKELLTYILLEAKWASGLFCGEQKLSGPAGNLAMNIEY